MINEIKRSDIPKSVDKLIEFWSQHQIIGNSPESTVQNDIIAYLSWIKFLLNENSELRKALEYYLDETFWCGNCDTLSYNPELTEVARKALERSDNK